MGSRHRNCTIESLRGEFQGRSWAPCSQIDASRLKISAARSIGVLSDLAPGGIYACATSSNRQFVDKAKAEASIEYATNAAAAVAETDPAFRARERERFLTALALAAAKPLPHVHE